MTSRINSILMSHSLLTMPERRAFSTFSTILLFDPNLTNQPRFGRMNARYFYVNGPASDASRKHGVEPVLAMLLISLSSVCDACATTPLFIYTTIYPHLAVFCYHSCPRRGLYLIHLSIKKSALFKQG